MLNDDLLSRECAVLPEELGVAAAKEVRYFVGFLGKCDHFLF